MEYVMLDSCIIEQDYLFRRSHVALLRDFLTERGAKLVVPRIVLEEVIHGLRRKLYERDPPSSEFLNWSNLPREKRRKIMPPL